MLRENWQNKWRQVVVKNKANIFKIMVFPFLMLLGNVLAPLFDNPQEKQRLKEGFLNILSACECEVGEVRGGRRIRSVYHGSTIKALDLSSQEQAVSKIKKMLIDNDWVEWIHSGWNGKSCYYCKDSVQIDFYKIPKSGQVDVLLTSSAVSATACR